MRWPAARSRTLALLALALGLAPGTRTSAPAQEAKPAAETDSDAKAEKRIEDLDKAIRQQIEAGRTAGAVPLAREKLDLMLRLKGKDHWQTGDARREVETYQRLAARPQAVQDRFAEASREAARVAQTYVQGRYAEASDLCQKTLTILREILGEEEPLTATSEDQLAVTLSAQARYAEAEAMHRHALTIRLKALGDAHPDSAFSYTGVAGMLDHRGRYAEAEAMHRHALAIRLRALGEAHPLTALSYSYLAGTLNRQGKHAEAEAMDRRALAIRLKALGDAHPDTATTYSNLAVSLMHQGRHAEGEAMHRRALAILLKTRGETHPLTAGVYGNLAASLSEQGKYAEAEAMQRRVLAIRLKALGDAHPDTAFSYDSLAVTLLHQARYAESEAMQRRALAIRLKALGEAHPNTAFSYSNLAVTLHRQGRLAEAEAMNRRALASLVKALGESHRYTASSCINLATSLSEQGKYAEAEDLHRRAVASFLKAVGEAHPDTASAFNNLAGTLTNLGRHDEAEATYRRALAIRLKTLGEAHPDTAFTYNGLAAALDRQGKYAEAEAMQRRALAIRLKALGDAHPDTAATYNNLAGTQAVRGHHAEALRTWRLAAACFEQARLLGPRGFETASGSRPPFPNLAAALARDGRPRDAWSSWERGLARGIVDEVTRRAARPLTDDERHREADLLGRGQAVDERISKLLSARALTQDQERALDDLRQQASEIRRQLLDLERQFEEKYGALASRAATLEEAQKALPEGTALVGWNDARTGHWACLLGHSGDPAWVRLAGSGKEGAWTKDEEGLSRSLRAELDPEKPRGRIAPLAEAMARLRLDPLKGHLAGVRRLVVVNSPGLAGVPVEVLMAARPDPAWDGITVSYAPSAAMFAYLVGRPASRGRPATLLALADPAYPPPKDDAPAPEPPTSGLSLARIVPNGNADLNGIREGDILLTYNGTELKRPGDLKPVADDGGPRKVPVRYWRAGITRAIEVAAGPLGVGVDQRSPAEFVRAHRESGRVLLGMRGGSHERLPGTRREVEAIAGLFPSGEATTLLGARACESAVQGLARSGKLRDYRYLHFATHGRSDPRFAYRTALILAPDPDGSAEPTALETDGTITAEQIARTWELDADLVVLSACESGLGRDAGAEGYLGFAQPLFVRGARSLVLSQWKVDDDATALLMERFYRNLLGRRPGLSAPMPKAEALAEAKRWLRGADRSEVGAALAALPRGELVHREPLRGGAPAHPYADPIDWAAFVLVGAPD